MRIAWFIAGLLVLSACQPVLPPPPSPVVGEHYVKAPFDSVWNKVIDFFADSRVSIETIDRASGLIVSRPFTLPRENNREWVWCETNAFGQRLGEHPALDVVADFNVLVRPHGDSTAVRINAITVGRIGSLAVDCNSSGHFEKMLYQRIGARRDST